jgi:hypothetical protein
MSEKYLNCLFCKEFYFMDGQPGYSEMTPGSNAEIGCDKKYWELDQIFDTEESYRQKMLRAKTCKDFVEREDN